MAPRKGRLLIVSSAMLLIPRLLRLSLVSLALLLVSCSEREQDSADRQGSQADSAAVGRLWQQTLPDPLGQEHPLFAYRGKVLVVNYWATWCPPCRREMPAFSRLQNIYGKQNVQFLGIAEDSPERVREFVALHPVSYPLLISSAKSSELAHQLGNSSMGLPYTFILDAQEVIRFRRLGMVTETEMERVLQRIVQP